MLAASRSVDRLLVLCTGRECDELACCSVRYSEAVGCWLLAVGLQNNSRGDKMTESVVVLQGVSW